MGICIKNNEYLNGRSGIYKITNKLNDMSYIGQSTNIGARILEHEKIAGNIGDPKESALHRAMRSFGLENFEAECLATLDKDLDRDVFLRIEQAFIDVFRTRECGYNVNRAYINKSNVLHDHDNIVSDNIFKDEKNKDTIGGYVYTTKDYNQFKTMPGNRKMSKNHISQLKKSILKANAFTVPIIVNGKKEIIDGQHRLEAVKEIERTSGIQYDLLYIYQRDATVDDCVAMNAVASIWKNNDYIDHFISQKNENYIKLKKMINKYGNAIERDTIFAVCGGYCDGMPRQAFKHGYFKFREQEDIADEKLHYIEQFVVYFPGRKVPTVIGKLLAFIYNHKGINNSAMLTRFGKYYNNNRQSLSPISDRSTTYDVADFLSKVYNKFSSNKVNIATDYAIYSKQMEDKQKQWRKQYLQAIREEHNNKINNVSSSSNITVMKPRKQTRKSTESNAQDATLNK